MKKDLSKIILTRCAISIVLLFIMNMTIAQSYKLGSNSNLGVYTDSLIHESLADSTIRILHDNKVDTIIKFSYSGSMLFLSEFINGIGEFIPTWNDYLFYSVKGSNCMQRIVTGFKPSEPSIDNIQFSSKPMLVAADSLCSIIKSLMSTAKEEELFPYIYALNINGQMVYNTMERTHETNYSLKIILGKKYFYQYINEFQVKANIERDIPGSSNSKYANLNYVHNTQTGIYKVYVMLRRLFASEFKF